MDFQAVYKACKKSQALRRGVSAVKSCLERLGVSYICIDEVTVSSFVDVPGYRITDFNGVAFFPKDLDSLPNYGGVKWMQDSLSMADLVVPPYYSMNFIHNYAIQLRAADTEDDRMSIGAKMLADMYPADGIAEIICGVFLSRNTYTPFNDQLVESAKAYSLGLFSVAITSLLPCIEGVIRSLGVGVDLKVEGVVNVRQLLKVFDRLKAKEVRLMFCDYSWLPAEINGSLLARFNERVQMYEGISQYFSSKLYLHTDSAPASLLLNRHGIAHGLFQGYATPDNYLRLFNLLSSLSMVASMVEGKGSLMHPGESRESEKLGATLVKCQAIREIIK